jgi:hypothetical protein
VTNTDGAASGAMPVSGDAFIASEFQPVLAADQLAGDIDILSSFADADSPFVSIPVDGRVRLSIDLTNATFTSAAGASFTGNDGGNCAFESAPVAGGGVGNTSVGFISTAAAAINACEVTDDGDVGNIGGTIGLFSIPVARVDSSLPVNVTLTYTQVNADGSAVANPVTAAETLTYAELEAAWNDGGTNAFAAGVDLIATSAGILADGTLGTVTADFRDLGTGGLDINAHGGAQVTDADLFTADSELLITFPAGVGDVATVAVAGGGACTGPVADVFTCALSAAQLVGLSGAAITYTVGGGATPPVTPEQTPTATITTDTQDDYVAAGFSGDLAEIKHDDGLDEAVVGAANDFGWVRFGAGGTESNFRVSMASDALAAAITQVIVTPSSGNGGVTAGTPVTLLPGSVETGFAISGSTIVFNSRGLGAASGETGNADLVDIELQFDETAAVIADVTGATIQRQLVNRTPSSFVAAPGLGQDN